MPLDVCLVEFAGGGVKPVAEIRVNGAAVAGEGAVPAVGSDRECSATKSLESGVEFLGVREEPYGNGLA